MTTTVASAPGKIVVTGEYAVLSGAPAIAMAVDRRAHITIEPIDGHAHTLEAPGFLEGSFRFRQHGAEFEWLDAVATAGGFELFESVLTEAAFAPEDFHAYCVDTRAFHDSASGRKLGLGSSAAVAVALAGACSRAVDSSGVAAELAAVAHSRFQGGRGSGIDIACAAQGGLIRYVRGGRTDTVSWPEGLHMLAFWSGTSSSTADKLADLDRRGSSSAARTLEEAAETAARVWTAGGVADVLDVLRQFRDCLQAYDTEHGIGIFSGGHKALVDLSAEQRALVYKPCGAGGGDVGMAFCADAAELERFAASAERLGFSRLGVVVDPTGLRIQAAVE